MIDIETLCIEFGTLDRAELEQWISHDWVRPEAGPEGYRFREIDVARVRLLLELRQAMQVNEDALPVVLGLLDQLYDARRRMRRMRDALHATAPDELRARLLRALTGDEG